MKRVFFCLALMLCFCSLASVSFADLQEGEKAVAAEMKKAIPADRIVTIDALYAKWQEVQAGTSKAVLIDLRTEAEFNCGHIRNSNNVDSGHAYTMPKLFPDPETELWVFCRTHARAPYFASLLYKYGYKNVYMVDGGIVAWAEKGYPLVNTYMGEIKVLTYEKKLKEDFISRENR